MLDKFFKNPKYMGMVAVITLVLVIALIWDSYKNPRKDFFGVLKSSTPSA
jgi:hypothetical protein